MFKFRISAANVKINFYCLFVRVLLFFIINVFLFFICIRLIVTSAIYFFSITIIYLFKFIVHIYLYSVSYYLLNIYLILELFCEKQKFPSSRSFERLAAT